MGWSYNGGLYLGGNSNRYMILFAPYSTESEELTIHPDCIWIKPGVFENHQKIKTVTVASREADIPDYAFKNCTSLTTVTIKTSSIYSIGVSAFEKCENLTTIGNTNATKLEEIEQYAFSGCSKITTLDFTNNTALTRIGDNAFRGCTNLESVTFDEALKEIGNKAFYNTQNITTLVLPKNLTRVGDESFVNAGLTQIELQSGSDTSFGVNSFSQYKLVGDQLVPQEQITTLTLNGNLSLDKVFTDYAKQVRFSLSKLHVTGERIAPQSYKGCINLTDLTIDSTVKAIGESAFEECTLITEVTLNTGITEIARNTFKNCINLETISLPDTVKTVRNGAFDGCVKVANLNLSNSLMVAYYRKKKYVFRA